MQAARTRVSPVRPVLASNQPSTGEHGQGIASIADRSLAAWQMIEFPTISQARGSLTVAEVAKTVPFDVQRTFFVYNVPTAELRGAHAHRTCHQLLICVHGSVSADVRSQGERATFHLTTPSEGLLIRAGTWGGQHSYSADAVLCVLASQPYDASDYIHDLADFEGYERRLRRTTEAGTQHAYGQES